MATEITLIASFVLAILGYWGYTSWASNKANEVLEGPAHGAAVVYFDRGEVPFRLARLGAQIQETRAPGRYLEALKLWSASLHPAARRDDAPWVKALVAQEREEALAWLAKEKVSPDEVTALQQKLEKISPQLSDRETAVLEQLTSSQGLWALGKMQEHTLEALFAKLHDLGASDRGLKEHGLSNWMQAYR